MYEAELSESITEENPDQENTVTTITKFRVGLYAKDEGVIDALMFNAEQEAKDFAKRWVGKGWTGNKYRQIINHAIVEKVTTINRILTVVQVEPTELANVV